MKTYTIRFNREEFGYVNLEADSEEEAIEMFEEQEYDNDLERIKNGQTDIESIEVLK